MRFVKEQRGEKIILIFFPEEAELDRIACNMFEENRIPYLVPFSILYRDGEISVEYDISGLRSLENVVTSIVTRLRLSSILSGFVNAYGVTEEYLLNMDNVIFNRGYVFFNAVTEEPLLLYLPIVRTARTGDKNMHYIADLLELMQFDIRDIELQSFTREAAADIRSGEIANISALRDLRLRLNLPGADSGIRKGFEAGDEFRRQEEVSAVFARPLHQTSEADAAAMMPSSVVVPEAGSGVEEEGASDGNAGRRGLFSNKKKEKKDKPTEKKARHVGSSMAIPGVENEPVPAGTEENLSVAEKKIPEIKGKNQKAKGNKAAQESSSKHKLPFGAKGRKEPAGEVPEQNRQQEEGGSATRQKKQLGYGREIIPGEVKGGTVMFSEVSLLDESSGEVITLERFPFTIGREKDCDLCIGNEKVSRSHAIIHEGRDGGYLIEDDDSANGTRINGEKLEPHIKMSLQDGDQIHIWKYVYIFQIDGEVM